MKPTDWQLPESMTTRKISVQEWANQAVQSLNGSETPTLDVQVLMAFALGEKREWLITHGEAPLDEQQLAQLSDPLQRLQAGEPLAYITGKRSFYGLDFKVTPDVLVPRPETELLVEEAIRWLEAHPGRRKAIDVGTGSGIIAISLADRFADLEITGIDISQPALIVAQENAAIHGLQERISWRENDLLAGLTTKFDLIAANLPYIPRPTLEKLAVLHHEPRLALDGGPEGLDLIERLLQQSQNNLKPGGLILLEIEATQGETALNLAKKYYPKAKADCLHDYADLPRLIKIQL